MVTSNNTNDAIDQSQDISQPLENLHADEKLKYDSLYLRGTILDSLIDPITGAVSEDDAKLLKFHGIYQQDNRDYRDDRRRRKLEPDYSFMVRVRIPGGVCSAHQFGKMIEFSKVYANGTLRLTTRQTVQFHEVKKKNLKPLIKALDSIGFDTRAACGDDTRGVMCAVNPHQSRLHSEVYSVARQISARFIPKTGAYQEIWLDKPASNDVVDEEPLYGRTYLPRKFKIGLVVPPENDIDVFTQDLGFIAISENEQLAGYNLSVGGGMGHTDNISSTYPRLGDVIGYIKKQDIFGVAEAAISIQRDFGNRVDRARARFKYTLDDKGIDWFVNELEARTGKRLGKKKPFKFLSNGEQPGWKESERGNRHYLMFVENGRIQDSADDQQLTALINIAKIHAGEFRITPNQNVLIANIKSENADKFEKILSGSQTVNKQNLSAIRTYSIACVAFPTCGLAMAESERYLPELLTRIEGIMDKVGISDIPITIRMSGCPNGCSRPYVSEIGLTGRAPGKYNLYLGGAHDGTRLNRLFKENIDEQSILDELASLFMDYAKNKRSSEHFGDFVIRQKYVKKVMSGTDFKQKPGANHGDNL